MMMSVPLIGFSFGASMVVISGLADIYYNHFLGLKESFLSEKIETCVQ